MAFLAQPLGAGGADQAAKALADANTERRARYTNQFRCVRRGAPIVRGYDPRRHLPAIAQRNVMGVGPQARKSFATNKAA